MTNLHVIEGKSFLVLLIVMFVDFSDNVKSILQPSMSRSDELIPNDMEDKMDQEGNLNVFLSLKHKKNPKIKLNWNRTEKRGLRLNWKIQY